MYVVIGKGFNADILHYGSINFTFEINENGNIIMRKMEYYNRFLTLTKNCLQLSFFFFRNKSEIRTSKVILVLVHVSVASIHPFLMTSYIYRKNHLTKEICSPI